eukprot:669975-Pyramimonas_sp.AAC.1
MAQRAHATSAGPSFPSACRQVVAVLGGVLSLPGGLRPPLEPCGRRRESGFISTDIGASVAR